MKAVVLESDRLYYEPLSRAHLSQRYVDWMNDSETIKYLESGGNYSLQKLEEFLLEQEKKQILFWAIRSKESGSHIGNIKIDPIDYKNLSGEYGILMGEKTEWGKGYAKEASQTIIKYCFEVLNLSQITLGVVEANINAVKLYEKLGFKEFERIADYGVYDDVKCDSIRMIITND